MQAESANKVIKNYDNAKCEIKSHTSSYANTPPSEKLTSDDVSDICIWQRVAYRDQHMYDTATKFCMTIKLDERQVLAARPRPVLALSIPGWCEARSVCGSYGTFLFKSAIVTAWCRITYLLIETNHWKLYYGVQSLLAQARCWLSLPTLNAELLTVVLQ